MADMFDTDFGNNHGFSLNRRDFLKLMGAAGVATSAGGLFYGFSHPSNAYAASGTYSPIRPPATPLIVRSPYVSTWSASDTLAGTWPTFWTGDVKAITGIARIDGTAYVFMGSPMNVVSNLMTQVNLQITSTQSIYTLQAGGITLTITFLSPIDPYDLKRQSIPLSYIFAKAQSNDGNSHTVSLYFDISGEWAHSDSGQQVNWSSKQVAHSGGNLTSMSFSLVSPTTLSENRDYPTWGYPVWATATTSILTTQIGQDTVVRGAAASNGVLNNSIDSNMPRAINNAWPVLGFNFALGSVGTTPTAPVQLVLGHVRTPAVSYQGKQLNGLWTSYWSSSDQMLAFFYDDVMEEQARANALDDQVIQDATAVGGGNYAAICSLAVRQALGATELVVGPNGASWLMLKEISSDGNVSTIDVAYPGFPILLYLNPSLLSLLLAPILYYSESGLWPQTFCVHDLGSSYPNATGHNDGGGENMPVEETANMLIMTAAYVMSTDTATGSAFVSQHYTILKQWANYLNASNGGNPSRPNALDPLLQNQTDDFTGFIAHGTNLALKGILGIGAMGILANIAGNTSDASNYFSIATNLMPQWVSLAQDSSGQHQMISYVESDTASGTGAGSWSLKYNSYPDKVLGLNIIPSGTLTEETNWYLGREHTYGIQLDSRNNYTKADWELWVAAGMGSSVFTQYIINSIYSFANSSSSRVPFSDWYDTSSGNQVGFQARPVIGGLFALATLSSHAGGLVGYWPLDEGSGTTTSDLSGYGYGGTLIGNVSWTTGKVGKSAISLDGSTGYVDVPSSIINTVQSYSVAAWVKLNSIGNFATVMSVDGANVSGFYLQLSGVDNRWAFSALNSDSTSEPGIRALSTSAPATGTWYHLVGIYNANAQQLALYVNGTLQSTKSYRCQWQATGHLVIGRGKYGGNVDFFPGVIDDARMYNRVLSQAEITALAAGGDTGLVGAWAFNENTGTTSVDGSGNGHTATLTGSAGWTTGRLGASALNLNGSTAYADIPAAIVDTTQSYAVAAWVKMNSTGNWATVAGIDGASVSGFFLQYSGIDNRFAFSALASDSTSASVTRALATSAPVAGVWYHVVGMYDASAHTLSLYVNGKLQSIRSFTSAWRASGHTSIGRGFYGGGNVDFFPGVIDEVHFYKRVLTQAEIALLAR
jgi:Domain of unknown function (DUF5127)/Domain of unknown function (DUF4965)/Domain of unknown function (DUF1793)/Concanavalin A-like lectin/glucanases superfamily/Domain of unknown function (DUF4964)